MANTQQSKKRVRQIERRTAVRKQRHSRVRTFIRKLEEAITSGDKELSKRAFIKTESEIMRAVKNKIFHKNKAIRKVSRLARKVNSLS